MHEEDIAVEESTPEKDAVLASTFDNQDFEDESEADAEDESDDSTSPELIEVNGESYTAEELAELLSKGKDYTKKTQELAEHRKALEAAQNEPPAPTDPESLAQRFFGEEDWEDLAPGEQKVATRMMGLFQTLYQAVSPVIEEHSTSAADRASVAKFSSALEREVSITDIRAALNAAGGDELKAVRILERGVKPAPRDAKKPITPGATRKPDVGGKEAVLADMDRMFRGR